VRTKEDLLELAAASFGFLESSGGACRTDDVHETTLGYPLGEAFVELELDWRERAAFVLVGWCQDGRIPDGYYVDSYGTVVRHHLTAVLDRGDAADRAAAGRLRKAVKLSGPEAMAGQINAFADVLRAVSPRLPALLTDLSG
jgi:hypothetical protein